MTLPKYSLIRHNRPYVTDNFGIKSFEVSPRNANTTLVLEEHSESITYTATDFNGNSALCTFVVNVEGETNYFLSCFHTHVQSTSEKEQYLFHV